MMVIHLSRLKRGGLLCLGELTAGRTMELLLECFVYLSQLAACCVVVTQNCKSDNNVTKVGKQTFDWCS